ncbi:MAG: MBL fold metallo-hydrolase [Bacteroidota bacterium]
MNRIVLAVLVLFGGLACANGDHLGGGGAAVQEREQDSTGLKLMVLGIAQDAGFPQAACAKSCCTAAWKDKSIRRMVSCLGVVDEQQGKSWMFDATPDFKDQLQLLSGNASLEGVFLTHGHMGHYTGLMQLGREAMGASSVPVYVMPRMSRFLRTNGPWGQLVQLRNIQLQPIVADTIFQISATLSVQPVLVPHRDEYTETVGFLIAGPTKSALFIPDIDKWSKWERSIVALIREVDYAFLDGTFYQNGELPGRDMSEIPHPFVEESMALFEELPKEEKSKIYFIHFNHTNPLLRANSSERQAVREAGFRIAEEGMTINL